MQCQNGPNCIYYQAGKCQYYHPQESTIQIMMRQEEVQLTAKLGLITQQQGDLETQINVLRWQHQILQREREMINDQLTQLKHNTGQVRERFLALVTQAKSYTRSNVVPYHHKPVVEFKVEAEILKTYEIKLLAEARADVELYRTHYVYLGNRLKQALKISDAILNIIRNYCCDGPIRDQRTFPKQGYSLVMCPSNGCSTKHLIIENDGRPKCYVCKEAISPDEYYVLYRSHIDTKKTGTNYFAVFFHCLCIDEWGLCIPGEDTTHAITGDIIDLKSDIIHLTRKPSNICFADYHKVNNGNPIILVDNRLVSTDKDFCQDCNRFTCPCPCKRCHSNQHKTGDHVDSDEERSEPVTPETDYPTILGAIKNVL